MKVPDHANAAIALFDPRQLTLAREARGLLKSELAETLGVTKVTIGNYEMGKGRPSPSMVRQLALALGVPVEFFADISGRTPEQPVAYFRRLRATTNRRRLQARAAAAFAHQLVVALEQRVQLPKLAIPQLRLGSGPSAEDIEHAASLTRRALESSNGPLGMLVRRIERLGCVVIRLPVNETGIDAFSVPYSDRPIMVLGSDSEAFDRYRWNAAHELGHLVIHGKLRSEPTKEQEAHADRFAASLLMPAAEARFLLPRYVDWSVFLALKRDWGVSIAALINRAHQLELLTDAQRTRAFKTMSYRGWRKQEPVDLGPPESPSLLELAVQATMETQGIDEKGVARMARLAIEDVERLVSGAARSKPVVSIPLEDKARSGISSTNDDMPRRRSDAM